MTNDTQSGEVARLRVVKETLTADDESTILTYARDLCCDQLMSRSHIWAAWEAMKKVGIATPQPPVGLTASGEVARLRAALQEIIDVRKNVPIKMNSPPFLRMTWIANRRREIAELALSEQPQPTGRTDSERLDWLESKASMRVSSVYIDSQTSRYTVDNWQTHTDTLRDAIDAAMDSAKEAE